MPLVKCPACGCEQVVSRDFEGLQVSCEECRGKFKAIPYRKPSLPTPWLMTPGQMGVALLVTVGLAGCVGTVMFGSLYFTAKHQPALQATAPVAGPRVPPAITRPVAAAPIPPPPSLRVIAPQAPPANDNPPPATRPDPL